MVESGREHLILRIPRGAIRNSGTSTLRNSPVPPPSSQPRNINTAEGQGARDEGELSAEPIILVPPTLEGNNPTLTDDASGDGDYPPESNDPPEESSDEEGGRRVLFHGPPAKERAKEWEGHALRKKFLPSIIPGYKASPLGLRE